MLGPVRAWSGSQEVRLGPQQRQAVLAVLLLGGGSQVPVHELVDAVWGEDPPASAVGSVRSHVYRLRRLLDPSLIRSVGDGYLIEVSPRTLDLAAFQESLARAASARARGDAKAAALILREALALWQGPALAGIRGEYAEVRRTRLEKLRMSALETGLAAELDLGAHTEAVAELTELVAAHPLDERFREMLMLALYRSGRQAEALAAYRQAQSLLADELGVDPGPALRSMYERIVRADTALMLTAPSPVDDTTHGQAATHAQPAGPTGTGPTETGPTGTGPTGTGPTETGPAEPVPQPSASPRVPVPAQLPSGLPVFVGRQDALERAERLLSRVTDASPAASTVVISAIAGMAGVGKTTFAVHWARRIADRFPDGRLFLDLRGFDPTGTPVPPERALRMVLEAFGVPPQTLPQDVEALGARYRTLLAGRRVLLLLDNARDAEQIRPLLPGASGSLVIVTSRNRLSGLIARDGAQPIHLDVLSVAEARDLLARRLGHERVAAEPEAVEEIVERCARLPLALAVLAARAVTRPAFPLAALVDELRDSQGSLEAFTDTDAAADVRAVFSWSYQALTPPAARLFRLLAVHPGPDVSPRAAASLAGLTVPVTRRLLTELTQANLVDEPAPGRFASHDLLRAYATELAEAVDDPEDLRAARHRMFGHYLHSACAAAEPALLIRHRITLTPLSEGVRPEEFVRSEERASAWFATEQAVLLAAVRQAGATGFDHHTWQLAWAIEHHLGGRGMWRELDITLHTAMAAARRLGDPTAEAHVLRGLGQAERYAGRVKEARAYLEQAIEMFREAGDMTALAESHRQLGGVLERQGELEAALHHAELCVELLPDTPENGRLRAWARNGVGWFHALLGRYEEALRHCWAALALAQEYGDDFTAAPILDSIGYAHHHLGQYAEAIATYEGALARYRRAGGVLWYESEFLTHIGDSQLGAGRPDAARAAWTEALDILERLEHPDAESVRAKLRRLG
ncbi:BTAD domain-containing putative transcriptional regulator [Streptomyces phyllanthi]